uniref:Tubulin beta 4B class IVb n=1 Tax=Ornithorhynchus anatinus TaxID=9258 RepID=A0A6I8MYH1_ORNAN
MREIVHLQAGQCGNQIGAKAASTFPEPCWWTWSPGLWTPSALGLSGRSSGRITSSSARAGPGTTGPRATTRRGPSWWTRCWTWSGRRRRAFSAGPSSALASSWPPTSTPASPGDPSP